MELIAFTGAVFWTPDESTLVLSLVAEHCLQSQELLCFSHCCASEELGVHMKGHSQDSWPKGVFHTTTVLCSALKAEVKNGGIDRWEAGTENELLVSLCLYVLYLENCLYPNPQVLALLPSNPLPHLTWAVSEQPGDAELPAGYTYFLH